MTVRSPGAPLVLAICVVHNVGYAAVDVLFTRSASRHGIAQARALYVLAHHILVFDAGDGMTLYVGPDRGGIDLEVGTVPGHAGGTYVVHVMKLRSQFVAEYRSRVPWEE